MFKSRLDLSGSTGTLIFSGDLTIESAANLKQTFIDALNQVSCLVINHESVDNFDLSYLQLLFSLSNTTTSPGNTFSFSGKHPDDFITLLKDAGCPEYIWLPADNSTPK